MGIRFLAGETIDGALTVNNTITLSGSSNAASTFTLTNTAPTPDSTWTFVPQYNSQDLVITGTGKFDVVSSGGTGRIDANGQIESIQALDVATAGGRFTGKSNRGSLGSIHIEQTTTSADGGYINLRTSASGSTTPTERFRITDTGAFSVGPSGTNYGSSGQVLTSQGNGVPTWTTPTTGSVTGSGTTNYVSKFTSASAIGNSSIFDNGNVGIGTDSPTSPTSVATFLAIEGVTAGIVLSDTGHADYKWDIWNSSGGLFMKYNDTTFGVCQLSSGQVGIGVTTPAAKLQIGSNVDPAQIAESLVHLLSSTASSTVNGFTHLKLDYTSGGSPSTAGAQIMFNQGYHSGNPDYTQPVGSIRGWKTGPDYSYGGGLQLLYQPDSGALGVLVGMTLTGDGYVGIGTASPAALLEISGIRENQIRLTSYDTTAAVDETIGGIEFYSSDTGNEGVKASISAIAANTEGSAYMTFSTGTNTEKMRLTSGARINMDVMAGHESEGIIRIGRYDANTTRYNEIKSYVSSTAASNYLKLSVHGGVESAVVDVMTLLGSGNVGIGEDVPSEKLDVAGKIQIQSGNWLVLRNSDNSNYGSIRGASDTSNDVTINTNSEVIRFKQSGKVGIGVTDPGKNVEIKGAASAYTTLRITSGSTTHGSEIEFGDSVDADYGSILQFATSAGEGGRMRFIAGATETMNLRGGNVGIGVTAPTAKLDISGNGSGGVSLRIQGAMTVVGSYYYGFMYDGGDIRGTTQSNIFYAGGSVLASTTIATWASLRISTPYLNTGAAVTNNYAIYQESTLQKSYFAGNVGIGQTAPAYKLQISGAQNANDIVINNTTTGINLRMQANDASCNIFTTGALDLTLGTNNTTIVTLGGTTLTCTGDIVAYSDERLKSNIKTLDGTKVYKMRGVSFDRIDTGKAGSGVIAQEIQEVAPELIKKSNDGTLGVAYGNLTGYLIEAIKEQQKQIDSLQEQIKKMSSEN